MNPFPTTAKLAFFLAAFAAMLHMAWWYNELPAIVPSHFDLQGNPDDTMKKSSFMVLMVAVHLHLTAIFGTISYLMPWTPDSMLNMPNKEYWLEPQRRDKTIREMQDSLLWIGTSTIVFMMSLFHLTSQVAIKKRATINPEFAWIFGVYMAAIIGFVIWSFWKYRLPADLR